MRNADDLGSASLMISLGIVMIALFLGLRQWYEKQARESDLSEIDRAYFARQDLRRGLGVALMLILAVGLSIGARIAPGANGHANLAFVEIWLGEIALLLVLIAMAGIDWLATRRYARQYRQSLARERIELLRDAIRESAAPRPDEIGEPKRPGE